MKNSHKRQIVGCLFGFFMMCALCGCSANGDGFWKKTSNTPYQMDTDMIYLNGNVFTIAEAQVAADYMWASVSKQYGSEMNEALLSEACFFDSDMTLEQYEKEYVLYREMLLLNCFSQMYEKESVLSEADKAVIQAQAEAFYIAHYEGQEKISLEDCVRVYTMYCQARYYQAQLHQSIHLTVSDEQVRVVTCGVVKLEKEEQALHFLQKLSEGGDFFSLAQGETENLLEHTLQNVTREDEAFPKEVIAGIFALEENEVSEVIHAEGAYYVVTVTDLYHDTLSAQHREQLVAERTNAYYEEVCSAYMDASEIFFNQEAWETLAFPSQMP